ncbi:MAG: TonB-dependent receptor [Verrucomicrobia bacterium]|nr:TonB-dependent receptor [Verrucomicrobiota bacterium]
MKIRPSKKSMLTLYAALAYAASTLSGQETTKVGPTPSEVSSNPASGDTSDEQVLVLDPFSVSTEQEGYRATDTLGGARVRTKLADTPSAVSVITPQFLKDVGITNAQDLLIYTTNTEIAGLNGNFSGAVSRGAGISISGSAEGARLAQPTAVNRSRGLTNMDNTRNYFQSDIPWDSFNISRVDISRGPNSFLFGVGSPSGIANVSTVDATYKNEGNVEFHYGSFGTTRESLDINKVLIPSQLAVRLDMVNDDTQFRQKPAFNHSKRVYGAVRFDPKIFATESSRLKIQANFESGRANSNEPRTLPPVDYVTGYLNDPRASATGYNPWTYKFNDSGGDPTASYWTSNGSIANQYQWGSGAQYFWDAKTGALLKAGQSGWTAPTSASYGSGDVSSNIYHVHTMGYQQFAKASNYAYIQANGVDDGEFKGAYKGTVNYQDKTLSDRTVFDYVNNLIDGPNKREWKRWNAYNVSLVESLFNEKLVIQAVVDHQEYDDGQEGLLNSRTPAILLDLDSYLLTYPSWLPEAQTNPNVGRPVVFGDYGSGKSNYSTRDSYQLTAATNLDFKDLAPSSTWAKILGRHEITGLGGSYTKAEESRAYKMYGVDPTWALSYGGGSKLSDNGINWLAYMGPSMLGTSGSGAFLSGLTTSINPTTYPLTSYVKSWKAGTSVDPAAVWNITLPNGTPKALTQADNPANYIGYYGLPTNVRSSTENGYTGGSKREQRITSKAILYQGHIWDDTIIPSFGWRKDTTRQRGNTAPLDSTTGIYSIDYKLTDSGIKSTTTSKSYGVAVHLPKSIKDRLPEGTDVSLYYFHGANETPKVRYGIDGSQLPNETGKTNEYAVQVDAFHNRLSLRLTKFKTENSNAQASYGQPLGTNGWMIDSLPVWTVTMAASALAVQEYGVDNVPKDLADAKWLWQWAVDHPDVAQQIATSLKTDFAAMFPQSYWDQYGSNVDMTAVKNGDWLHVLKDNSIPWPWNGKAEHSIHGQTPIIDQNLASEGYELEATVRPLKNWDVKITGSKTNAYQTSLGAAASNYLNNMAKLWIDSPIGKVANWGGYTDYGAQKQNFMQNLWAPYLTQVALTGSDQPEVKKWKFNIVTNYKFDRGIAKGFKIGAAYRWEDKAILGYGTHLATVYGESAWIADVNQPLYGPTEEHVDIWFGYEHKLTTTITWAIQLNIRNIKEHAGLVPVSLEPDGTVAQSRIKQGQTYDLSMKFMF